MLYFQNFISSPQRDTEKSFLKELNDLLIQQKESNKNYKYLYGGSFLLG